MQPSASSAVTGGTLLMTLALSVLTRDPLSSCLNGLMGPTLALRPTYYLSAPAHVPANQTELGGLHPGLPGEAPHNWVRFGLWALFWNRCLSLGDCKVTQPSKRAIEIEL